MVSYGDLQGHLHLSGACLLLAAPRLPLVPGWQAQCQNSFHCTIYRRTHTLLWERAQLLRVACYQTYTGFVAPLWATCLAASFTAARHGLVRDLSTPTPVGSSALVSSRRDHISLVLLRPYGTTLSALKPASLMEVFCIPGGSCWPPL